MKEMLMDVSASRPKKKRTATPNPIPQPIKPLKLPPGFVASRLAALITQSKNPLCYVAASEGDADRIAEAISALFPEINHVVFPPWDCLPYDRVPPSRHCMGRRVDALRIWTKEGSDRRLLLTSLEALFQRVPPEDLIAESVFELEVGKPFDRDAFMDFIRRTGYTEEGVADDPGELVVRDGVIDIYPAGAPGPMRIVLDENDTVIELHGFNRLSQRTESSMEKVAIGPASEVIKGEEVSEDAGLSTGIIETSLFRRYDVMPSVFDLLGDAALILGQGIDDRLEHYLEIIDDARQAHIDFHAADAPSRRSFYLDRREWAEQTGRLRIETLNVDAGYELPTKTYEADYRKSVTKFAQDALQEQKKVVIAGNGKRAEALYRRLEKVTESTDGPVAQWDDVLRAAPGTLIQIACNLQEGFVDTRDGIVVVAAPDEAMTDAASNQLLAEPELRIGDVVVHEDHGVGVLKNLETIMVENISRDAARLDYRDGDSILVPMQEFDKLWRYGSEPEAISLDRLHTEAWSKKRQKIAEDILSTARHLSKIAKHRQSSPAETFAPARSQFAAFTRRFPFAETRDQSKAINDVLADLASGRAMNRLVCGDVGFGKTEVALRAAAAVALSGGQVAVIAPTTVLARQHFQTFVQRFEGTGISVGLLSRLVKPGEAKQTKAALADGTISVVVATQAIFAKDVSFARLGLLIVDEEHRFGLKEKSAMAKLAPSLHTLMMSATPIPRTLQSAMVGVQEVSLLTTPPSRRRPVRTSLAAFDRASMRTGLMREHRRGGQSFVVVPRIEDIEGVEAILKSIVPELSVKVAHGKMPAAKIDETIVGFAGGDGDILLATNIIENGLDVPRANTMFIWHPERFGLAQLHQLRGRVGRSGAQGRATLLLEEGSDLGEDAMSRLSTLVESDRLGSGLAISVRDLDLRGGGDIAGDDQAGHMRVIGVGLYQKLLAGAAAKLGKKPSPFPPRTILQLDAAATIPASYVSDPATRLNLYAKLSRASNLAEIDDLKEEFEDRFGELPSEVLILLRTSRLQLVAARLGISKLEAGPKALALTFTQRTPAKVLAHLTKKAGAVQRDDRLIFQISSETGDKQLKQFDQILAEAQTSVK
ncbi:transcription-repair coupling factor (superfamily II helicase) [Agrobacterium larrymoorei]|uniref:Transcription-repair-coupling factor n=1 Tax=Agrobacterium larrymoorei TaxID=160699 RepID=A0AAJ2B8S6_9HYPH|nr:transcription-repair coupling factor (superfamily II helicase) [Agrobacterium larrymoorei]